MLTSRATSAASRIRTAAIMLGLGAGLALTGCSASGDAAETPADDAVPVEETAETTPEEAAVEEPAEEPDDAAVSGEDSSVEVTIDGEAVDIADPTVVCHEDGDTLTIAVGSTTGADGIGAILEGGDAPVVTSVALGSVDGTAMAWAERAPGEATATKDGSDYEITGSMMAVDAADPTAMDEKPFTMQITCP